MSIMNHEIKASTPRNKLLLINSRFLPLVGGGETYTMELISHFMERGWEVHLATNNTGRERNDWNGCRIHYIDGFDDDRLRLWECIPALQQIINKLQPDLVHIHNIMPFFVYENVVEIAKFPTVFTIHNTPNIPHRIFGTFNDYEAERVFVRQRLSSPKCDKLIVGSQYYLDAYSTVAPWITDTLDAEVLHFFPPRLTQGHFTYKKRGAGKTKLLFPSRIIKRKGIENAIEALAMLPDNFTMLLPALGSSEQRDQSYKLQIEKMIDALGIRDRIERPDTPVPPERMSEYYQASDIVILPSYYEGFGIAAVEAISWGLPTIASDTGGLREIITHRQNGMLIRPNDTKSLLETIIELANNSSLCDELAMRAKQTAQEHFSRQRHMEKMERIYAELMRK